MKFHSIEEVKPDLVDENKDLGSASLDRKTDVVVEVRELLAKATPWPWTTTPGTFWICDVGNQGCGVWSTAYPPLGEPFPFAEQEADAALLARAPELLSSLCDEIERLREQWNTRFNTLCGLCGARYLGPRDKHLHGYGACDVKGRSDGEECREYCRRGHRE